MTRLKEYHQGRRIILSFNDLKDRWEGRLGDKIFMALGSFKKHEAISLISQEAQEWTIQQSKTRRKIKEARWARHRRVR